MTPKEKAKELRDKMYLKIPSVYDPSGLPHYPIAKEMALIAVDEILDAISGMVDEENGYSADKYYEEVKLEIEKL
jgi:hypothetical protein